MLVIPRWFAIAVFTGVWAQQHTRTEDELLLVQASTKLKKTNQHAEKVMKKAMAQVGPFGKFVLNLKHIKTLHPGIFLIVLWF